jgi:TolB-like protein
MKRAIVGLLALGVLLLPACRSHQSRAGIHQQKIVSTLATCDDCIKKNKAAYAIRYASNSIDYYSRMLRGYPELAPDLARLHAKRAQAYAMLRNARMANFDVETARKLDPNVQIAAELAAAPAAPPAPVPVPPPAPGVPAPIPAPVPPAADLGPDGIPAHQGEPILIAVLDFKEEGGVKKYGKGIGEALANDLFNRGRFATVEREEMDKIIAEKRLSESDLVAKAGSEEGTQLLPVKFLVNGTITVEGNSVVVNAKFINWTNGQVVVSQMAKMICSTANVSFHFDEIAHDLGVKLEKAFLEKFPEE